MKEVACSQRPLFLLRSVYALIFVKCSDFCARIAVILRAQKRQRFAFTGKWNLTKDTFLVEKACGCTSILFLVNRAIVSVLKQSMPWKSLVSLSLALHWQNGTRGVVQTLWIISLVDMCCCINKIMLLMRAGVTTAKIFMLCITWHVAGDRTVIITS